MDPELQWWQEDAQRVNAMSDLARRQGHQIVTKEDDELPLLNPDGSMQHGSSEYEEDENEQDSDLE